MGRQSTAILGAASLCYRTGEANGADCSHAFQPQRGVGMDAWGNPQRRRLGVAPIPWVRTVDLRYRPRSIRTTSPVVFIVSGDTEPSRFTSLPNDIVRTCSPIT